VDRPSYNNVCTTEYVQDCEGGGYTVGLTKYQIQYLWPPDPYIPCTALLLPQNTYEAPPPCAKVPHQVCSQVAEYTKETECTKVPKRSCVTRPRSW
jgi:hypothetical protein